MGSSEMRPQATELVGKGIFGTGLARSKTAAFRLSFPPLHTNGSSTTLCASKITRRSCLCPVELHCAVAGDSPWSVSIPSPRYLQDPVRFAWEIFFFPSLASLLELQENHRPPVLCPSTPSATASSGNPTPSPIAYHRAYLSIWSSFANPCSPYQTTSAFICPARIHQPPPAFTLPILLEEGKPLRDTKIIPRLPLAPSPIVHTTIRSTDRSKQRLTTHSKFEWLCDASAQSSSCNKRHIPSGSPSDESVADLGDLLHTLSLSSALAATAFSAT